MYNSKENVLGFFNFPCLPTLYSNAFFLILNNVVNSLLGFLFWKLMSFFYSPTDVGIGSALVASSTLIGMFSSLGMGIGLVRYIPEMENKAEQIINSSFTLAGIITIIFSFISFVGLNYFSPPLVILSQRTGLLFLYILFTTVMTLSLITDQAFVAVRSAKYVFWKSFTINITKLPLPIFIFTQLSGFGIFAGVGLAVLIGTLLSWYIFLPLVYIGYSPRPYCSKSIICTILPYSLENFIANLLSNSPGFIYPLMILNVLGPEFSAYFYISWMMTTVLTIIPIGITQSFFAESSYNTEHLVSNGKKVLLLSTCISLPAVGLMILISGWLLNFFGNDYAANGTILVRLLSLGVIPQCINTLYMTINQVKKCMLSLILQAGTQAFIALGIGYWLLNCMGLNGIGIAYALAQLIIALFITYPLYRALNSPIHIKRNVSVKQNQ